MSETHVVTSHELSSTRATELASHLPMPAENTDMLVDPVAARLTRESALVLIKSAEYTVVRLCTFSPAVSTICLLPCPCAVDRHCVDESYVQPVASAADPAPTEARYVIDGAIPAPSRVMLTDSVPTVLPLLAALARPASADNADDTLPL